MGEYNYLMCLTDEEMSVHFDQKSEQFLQPILSLPNNNLSKNPLPWEKLGRVGVIKSWSEEIKSALIADYDSNDWQLVGHAITIVHDNVDDCQEILQRVAYDIGFDFRFIHEMSVKQIFSDAADLTPYENPTLIYMEPGKWLEEIEDDTTEDIINIQENICESVRRFNPKLPIIFVISTDDFSDLSVKFRRAGLFDRRFNIIRPTLEEIAANFIEMVGMHLCDYALNEQLGKVGKLLDMEFSDRRRQELIALTLKRLAKKENRKICFSDLVDLSLKGSAESDVYPLRHKEVIQQIAIHEAGHATVAIVDSQGKNIPEYAGVIESHQYNGIVADSFAYHYSKNGKRTYADVRHQIRILIAGRVAEHLVLGAEDTSIFSAKDDFERASDICYDMFAKRAISNDMESLDGAMSNLFINPAKASSSEVFRIESNVRAYLKKQYKIVYEILERHRNLLDEITNRLMSDRILDQEDINEICECFMGTGQEVSLN